MDHREEGGGGRELGAGAEGGQGHPHTQGSEGPSYGPTEVECRALD